MTTSDSAMSSPAARRLLPLGRALLVHAHDDHRLWTASGRGRAAAAPARSRSHGAARAPVIARGIGPRIAGTGLVSLSSWASERAGGGSGDTSGAVVTGGVPSGIGTSGASSRSSSSGRAHRGHDLGRAGLRTARRATARPAAGSATSPSRCVTTARALRIADACCQRWFGSRVSAAITM